MDARAACGSERRLRRIVRLLVALATLAERAAQRSWPVRCLVLWFVLRAETVAGDWLLEVTGMELRAMAGSSSLGHGPADALSLAARLYALAAALGALLPLAEPDRRPAWRRASLDPASLLLAGFHGGWRPEPNDTS